MPHLARSPGEWALIADCLSRWTGNAGALFFAVTALTAATRLYTSGKWLHTSSEQWWAQQVTWKSRGSSSGHIPDCIGKQKKEVAVSNVQLFQRVVNLRSHNLLVHRLLNAAVQDVILQIHSHKLREIRACRRDAPWADCFVYMRAAGCPRTTVWSQSFSACTEGSLQLGRIQPTCSWSRSLNLEWRSSLARWQRQSTLLRTVFGVSQWRQVAFHSNTHVTVHELAAQDAKQLDIRFLQNSFGNSCMWIRVLLSRVVDNLGISKNDKQLWKFSRFSNSFLLLRDAFEARGERFE